MRDLLLGRRPKDFDVGTDAHPYQIKKLFRNCWIIGRRFRLAHVKFGLKVIEVATFRRIVPETPEAQTDASSLPEPEAVVVASSPAPVAAAVSTRTQPDLGCWPRALDRAVLIPSPGVARR